MQKINLRSTKRETSFDLWVLKTKLLVFLLLNLRNLQAEGVTEAEARYPAV
jgi:hypothetical protein